MLLTAGLLSVGKFYVLPAAARCCYILKMAWTATGIKIPFFYCGDSLRSSGATHVRVPRLKVGSTPELAIIVSSFGVTKKTAILQILSGSPFFYISLQLTKLAGWTFLWTYLTPLRLFVNESKSCSQFSY